MKTKMTLKEVLLALWAINATLVLIGATAVLLDQLNII